MKNLLFAALWLCVLGIAACRKEPVSPIPAPCEPMMSFTPVPPDTCFDLPFNPLGFVNATTHWPIISYPQFCPFDPNRIVYKRSNNNSSLTEISVANLCDGIITAVYSGASLNYPEWSTNDWILFNSYGGTSLHKIKSNGDSLTLLSNLSGILSYYWMNNGALIQASWHNTPNTADFVLNSSGVIIDTLPLLIGDGSYRNGQIITFSSTSSPPAIGLINTGNWQFTPLIGYSPNKPPGWINWLDDHNVIWSNESGIYKMNIQSGEVTTVKETPCQNLRYRRVNAAPDGSGRLLTSRLEYIYVTPDSLVEYQRISLLDTHTGQEWILGLED